MITLDNSIPPTIQQTVEQRLQKIEQDYNVKIILAIESGSRAWGFPSPDSDYDIRFLYVHSRDWYLSLYPGENVIELPIVDEIDLNGWDIRKAITLLLKSNAVINEWMSSPIQYRKEPEIIESLLNLATDVLNPRALVYHYNRNGIHAADRWLQGSDKVPVKKYFYALRPALAIRAMRINPSAYPPMNLQELIAVSDLPSELIAHIQLLVHMKSQTNERSNGIRITAVDDFIRSELMYDPQETPKIKSPELVERADSILSI